MPRLQWNPIKAGFDKVLSVINELTDVQAPNPVDNQRLAWSDDIQRWIPKYSESSLGFAEFAYRITNGIDGLPASGRIEGNNADAELNTVLYINEENDDGIDITLFLENIHIGDWLNIHDPDEVDDKYIRFDVIGEPVRVNDVWNVPVQFFDRNGQIFINNQRVRLYIRYTKTATSTGGFMLWRNNWINGTYYETFNVVRDGAYTMIANKNTTERPAPQQIGEPFKIYDGTSPTTNTLTNQIVHGNRYTFTDSAYIDGYSIYTISGNHYRIFIVENPIVSSQVTELLEFTATTTGWIDLSIIPVIAFQGTVIDLISVISEPDPTPTVWSGNWDYDTPNNPATPSTGQIVQSNNTSGELRVHKTDNDGGDRSTELEALNVGDIIQSQGISWAIQTITDNGFWINFGVSPPTQAGTDGVVNFDFNTVSPTPITYLEDIDFWVGFQYPGQGIFSDVGIADVVINNNHYGVDISVQQASISEDWDLVSRSS